MAEIDLDSLRQKHPPVLVDAIRRLFSEQSPFRISAEELVSETSCRTEQAGNLLREMCPPLMRESRYGCPNCHFILSDMEAISMVCPECHLQYAEYGGVEVSELFVFHAPRTRDVAWVLALHGMNTRGAWQENFNWRV